jgi:hypothetical protein
MTKGEKRVIFISVFHLCVACDTLMACKTYYAYLISICGLDDYFCLSISYVYEMKCVVVSLYPCYIDVILCIFTI